ncbi:hypothetical protein LX32DRAFT_644896 [Colletotrichum zoysiae]|uniref:Secreted protein n=1 Tax=Colletotrichum zoysiae TaxID=1216348 RepID=A0AAD9LVV8_9PEZI|nr:hypothetical protein LX32DRAFT_644896 [Colletotrichum zoysiae]
MANTSATSIRRTSSALALALALAPAPADARERAHTSTRTHASALDHPGHPFSAGQGCRHNTTTHGPTNKLVICYVTAGRLLPSRSE